MFERSAMFGMITIGILLHDAPLLAQGTVPTKNSKQQADKQLPVIPDEPKAIDPGQLLPAILAVKATHDFSDSSLREVVSWLRDKQKFVVLVDNNALSEIGISPAEPLSDRLTNAPVYLLLNRLKSMNLNWYYDDDVLYITSSEAADSRTITLTYEVGDLMDKKFDLDDLMAVITHTIGPATWEDTGGAGALNSLGDVLFVRHTDEQQRSVRALLAALRNHGRQTFLNDPPEHAVFRQTLQQNVSVDFSDTPLETAVQQLAENAKSDIRLDRAALRDARIRKREPVTLKLAERKLATVLQAMLLDLNLTWILRDGVLWITTPEIANAFLRTAVYDVRDLCRDSEESDALIEAIVSQAVPDSWSEVGGVGEIDSAKPGTLVVTHQEQVHREVLHLLNTYRTALQSSKPRKLDEEKTNEIVTVYYRLNSKIATDLSEVLPLMIQPNTWSADGQEGKPGHIRLVASQPDLSEAARLDDKADGPALTLLVERSTLIIRQTRGTHKEIAEIIRRVETGDSPLGDFGGGQLGGGGFGGGF
ncbi:MAG: hypothetical protein P8N76_22700 [Pirellulaceae bacterium]|nr:hypothetical protein [Pirellulaceae bacterium]